MIFDPKAARFFLNLDRRPDRRETTERQFSELGVPIERFRAIDGANVRHKPDKWTEPGRHAVATGFLLMLREAERRRAPQGEFFEDDLKFHPNFKELFSLITLPSDWDVFYFGGIHLEQPEEVNYNLLKARRIIGNHAMIFRDRTFRTCREVIRTRGQFNNDKDVRLSYLPQLGLNVYCPSVNLIWQSEDYSDLQRRKVSYFLPNGTQPLPPRKYNETNPTIPFYSERLVGKLRRLRNDSDS